jgi:hypothetical protein
MRRPDFTFRRAFVLLLLGVAATAGFGPRPALAQEDGAPSAEADLAALAEELAALRRDHQAAIDRLQAELDLLKVLRVIAAAGEGGQGPNLTALATRQFSWSQGEPPVRMIHKDEGFCFLTRVGGGFEGGGEVVLIELRDDGYYYLTGGSGQSGVHAEATAVVIRPLEAVPSIGGSEDVLDGPSVSAVPEPTDPPAMGLGPPAIVRLPGSFEAFAVGGGGRFLILHLPQMRKLAVFDFSAGKVVKYISVAADDLYFAAGQDKLVAVLPARQLIQRWDLNTFDRDVSRTLQLDGTVTGIALGASSQGPIVLTWQDGFAAGGYSFLDLDRLAPLAVEIEGDAHILGDRARVWAAANGTVFGLNRPDVSPDGLATLVLSGAKATLRYEHDSPGYVIPSPDGRTIFTMMGLFTPELRRLTRQDRAGRTLMFPSVHPAYFLGVTPTGDGFHLDAQDWAVSVYSMNDQQRLMTLPPMEELKLDDAWHGGSLAERIFFSPEAGRLVTVPETRDALYVRNLDLAAALAEADVDYLFVSSVPVLAAARDATYRYPLAVESRAGGVRFALDSGPEGMRLSDDGSLAWDVPADYTEPSAAVIITVTDASGQEVLHAFEIAIDARASSEGHAPDGRED